MDNLMLIPQTCYKLGSRIFRECVNLPLDNVNRNICISPVNILTVLFIVGIGSPNTKDLLSALELEGISFQEWENICSAWLDYLSSSSNRTMTMAHALLFNSTSISKTFIQRVTDLCEASIFKDMDFSGDSEHCAAVANRWVKESTHGHIQDLVKRFKSTTKAVLLSALHFKDDWENPFLKENNRIDNFYLDDEASTTVLATYMCKTETVPCIFTPHGHIIELSYRNKNISMFICLPLNRRGLAELEIYTAESVFWETLFSKMPYRYVEMRIPIFKAYSQIDILPLLKGIGIRFNNLDEISRISQLQIDNILHTTAVDIDEKGTEASAVTSVMETDGPPRVRPSPFIFNVSYPFLYVIADKKTKSVLFMGRIKRID